MSTLFCSECGSKHDYSVSKPKFCQGCGHQMGSFSVSSAKDTDSSEGSSGTESIPNISKLQYEIESVGGKTTLGSLVSSPINPDDINYPQGAGQSDRQKFTVQDSMSECAPSRETKEISS